MIWGWRRFFPEGPSRARENIRAEITILRSSADPRSDEGRTYRSVGTRKGLNRLTCLVTLMFVLVVADGPASPACPVDTPAAFGSSTETSPERQYLRPISMSQARRGSAALRAVEIASRSLPDFPCSEKSGASRSCCHATVRDEDLGPDVGVTPKSCRCAPHLDRLGPLGASTPTAPKRFPFARPRYRQGHRECMESIVRRLVAVRRVGRAHCGAANLNWVDGERARISCKILPLKRNFDGPAANGGTHRVSRDEVLLPSYRMIAHAGPAPPASLAQCHSVPHTTGGLPVQDIENFLLRLESRGRGEERKKERKNRRTKGGGDERTRRDRSFRSHHRPFLDPSLGQNSNEREQSVPSRQRNS